MSVNTPYGEYILKDYNTINASSITNIAKTIHTQTTGNQVNILTGGDYSLTNQTGTISLSSNNSTSEAIKLSTGNTNGGITLESGNQGITFNTSGEISLEPTGNISLGSNETNDIEITGTGTITISGDAITQVATNNIVSRTTNGQIILDTSGNSTESALRVNNEGKIILNSDTNPDGFQFEVHTGATATTASGRNGVLVNSTNSNINPEFRGKYTNSDGSRVVYNTLGVFSEESENAKYRTYTGFQYGNQLVTLEGPNFVNNDIGKNIKFLQDDRTTLITNLGTIILPADNTYASSELIVGGVYTGTQNIIIKIEIDTLSTSNPGSVDTFRWSSDGGLTFQGEYIPLSYAYNIRYPLQDGVYITFQQQTGHQVGDFWTVQAKRTAIVNSNIIINGSNTVNSASGTVFVSVDNNVITTTTGTDGSPVFSNITGNIALSRLQDFISTDPFQGYVGTASAGDLIFITDNTERMRITADGALGVSKDNIDGRLHLTSVNNEALLVNDNLMSSGAVNGGSITDTSNLGSNLLGYQINPTSTEINTGGHVIVYESQESDTNDYNIYANLFTAGGEKSGNSIIVNSTTTKNQSHPCVARSGIVSRNHFMCVWVSQDATNTSIYQIKGQLFRTGLDKYYPSNDITLTTVSTDVKLVPQVVGLTNGNYLVAFSSLENDDSNLGTIENYHIQYLLLNNVGQIIKTETTITTGDLNYTHPAVGALSSKDPNYPSGFVIGYMKQVYGADARYQLVYKVFSADGSIVTPEREITNTGYDAPGDIEADSDISLSDGRLSIEGLSDTQSQENGGFLVTYQTNFSSSVNYSDIVSVATRNIFGVNSAANGDLTGASIDSNTGIQTLNLENVNGSFIKGEQIYLISEGGYLTEKIATVSPSGTNATITLSKDPKDVKCVRYHTNNLSVASSNNIVWRQTVNSSMLIIDKERQNLTDSLPLDFIRANSIFYAYRGKPTLRHNNETSNGEILVAWQNGSNPSVYYQLLNINNGTKIGVEENVANEVFGLRQTDPVVSTLKNQQGSILGYDIAFSVNALDLSKTAIYQELVGSYSYLIHMNNKTAEFVVNHNAQMGIGTKNPDASLHLKTLGSNNPYYTDTASMILQTSSSGINTENDSHQVSFKDGDGYELVRMKVKYTDNYQDMNPNGENLVSYFKFDEQPGSLTAKDNGLFHIQSSASNVEVNSFNQNAQLIDFDVNKCWVEGKVNNGLRFDGLQSYMKVPKNTTVSTQTTSIDRLSENSFSVSMWIKVENDVFTGTRMDLISFGTTDIGTADGGYFQLYLDDVNDIGAMYPCINVAFDNAGDTQNITTTSKINDGSWHNLVYIHSRGSSESNIQIYLDNTRINNTTTTGKKVHNSQVSVDRDVFLGTGFNGTGNYLRGILDEMRFYNTPLNTTALTRLYKYGNEKRSQFLIQTRGDNTDFTDYAPGFILDDTGAIVNSRFKNNIFRSVTGTLVATSGSKVINGENTLFTKEVKGGDYLYIDNKSSDLEEGSAYQGELNKKIYQVISVSSDTQLTINRVIPDVAGTAYFSYVSVRPSILSAYDLEDNLKMNVDFMGDMVVGNGKSSHNITKLEVRGSGAERTSKNGLTLVNTSASDTSGSRSNKLIFKGVNSSSVETLSGLIEVNKDGSGSDEKSKMVLKVNGGAVTSNLDALTTCATFYSDGKVNIGVQGTESIINSIGADLHIESQDNTSAKLALFSNERATGVFTEKSSMEYYGVESYSNNTDPIVRIVASNDKPDTQDAQMANGRLDLEVNNESSSLERHLGPQSRLCITSQGQVGIHNQRPVNIFQASPKYVDGSGTIIANDTDISGINNTSKIVSIDTNVFSSVLQTDKLLRCGSLVVNDGSNLTSYVISSGIGAGNDLIPSASGLRLNSSETLDTNLMVNKDFTIHYPGFNVNEYGLVGIGDSRFNNTETNYHLTVSGKTMIKGVLALGSNIDSTSTDTISFQTTDEGRLQAKDSNSNGYKNIMLEGNSSSSNLSVETGDFTLGWNQSTIIVNSATTVTITLPTPSSTYSGRKFIFKKLGTGNVILTPTTGTTNIDGATGSKTISTQYESREIQTDGTDWYFISKYTP